MRTYRVFPISVWINYQTRTEFKAGRQCTQPRAADVFDKKFSSLKAAVAAARACPFQDIVVMKRQKYGHEWKWLLCIVI